MSSMSRNRAVHLLAPVTLLLLATTFCNDATHPKVCTEIGCESGVEVLVFPQPAGSFRVEVFPLGSPASYVRDCETAADCNQIFFADFTPDYVNVRVTTTTDTVFLEAVRLDYAEFQPNGPGCPPVCRTASVTVELPS